MEILAGVFGRKSYGALSIGLNKTLETPITRHEADFAHKKVAIFNSSWPQFAQLNNDDVE